MIIRKNNEEIIPQNTHTIPARLPTDPHVIYVRSTAQHLPKVGSGITSLATTQPTQNNFFFIRAFLAWICNCCKTVPSGPVGSNTIAHTTGAGKNENNREMEKKIVEMLQSLTTDVKSISADVKIINKALSTPGMLPTIHRPMPDKKMTTNP